MNNEVKVSIVDDNEIFRDGLRFFIENNTEWQILHEVSSGNEFVNLSMDEFPDIVLMDINMPGRDGFETTYKFMLKHARFDIKVIALTMYMNDFQMKSFMKAGISGCILKKDVYQHLIEAVETVLHKGVYFKTLVNIK